MFITNICEVLSEKYCFLKINAKQTKKCGQDIHLHLCIVFGTNKKIGLP
jgi:hypothetical protein